MKPFALLSATVIFVLALGIACLPGSGDEDDSLSSRDRRGTRVARAERAQLRTDARVERDRLRTDARALEPTEAPAMPATVPQPAAAATQDPAMPATAIPAPAMPATAPQPTATAVPRAEPTFVPTAAPFPTPAVQQLGGSLAIAVEFPSQRFARSWMMDAFSANALVRPFAEPLLHTDRFDGSIVSGLATGWELSDDGGCWIFHLRQDVAFHRGWGEFTAHDVIHSASLLVRDGALDFGIPTFRELFAETQGGSIFPIDDYTVGFCSSRPADVAQIVSAQAGNFFIYSKTQWDNLGEAGYAEWTAGTGPWELETPNVESAPSIVYSRVPNHWRQSPLWSELFLHDISEDAARLAFILSEQVFIAELPRDRHSQAADNGMRILESELPSIQVGLSMGGIYSPSSPFHTPSEPHLDVRVREAINRAIDRVQINEALFNGIGRPSPVWGYRPSQPGWNPRWLREFDSRYGYEPERAVQLLHEAGHNGYSLKVIVNQPPGVPEMRDIALSAAQYLAEIGIDVHTDEVPRARYIADFIISGQTHGTIAPIRSRIKPTRTNLRIYNHTDGGAFRTVPDGRLDGLYLAAVSAWDFNTRHIVLQQAGDIKFDQYAEAPLLWLPSQVVVNPDQIGEFVWPGNILAPFSHTEYITPALSR